MGKVPKATKKFKAKHLKPELERRKASKKFAQQKAGKSGLQKGQERGKGPKQRPTRQVEHDGEGGSEADEDGPDIGGFSDGSDNGSDVDVHARDSRKRKRTRGEGNRDEDGFEDFQDPGGGVAALSDSDEAGEDSDDEEEALRALYEFDSGSESDASGGDAVSEAGTEDDRMDLDKLKERDPEFYKYLEKNDKALLQFQDDEEGEQDEDTGSDGDEADEEEERPAKPAKPARDAPTLTKAMLAEWGTGLTAMKSLKAVKRVLLGMRTAVNMQGDKKSDQPLSYKIDEPSVLNKLIFMAIKDLPSVFDHHLPAPTGRKNPNKPYLPSSHPKWQRLQPLVRSHVRILLALVSQVSSASTTQLVLRHLPAHAPYFSCFPRTARQLLKHCLDRWSGASAEEKTRVLAYLAVRALATAGGGQSVGRAIRAMYLAYARSARSYTVHTAEGIDFMQVCFTEMVGVDQGEGYRVGFACLREMAGWLRTAMIGKEKDTHRKIYNWSLVLRLRLWARVLTEHCPPSSPSNSPLRLLIYPFVQLATGCIRINPAQKYYPFRLHVVRLLAETGEACGLFIPLASYLTDILETLMQGGTAGKGSGVKGLEWKYVVRAGKQYLGTRVYYDALIDEVAFSYLEVLAAVSRNIGFPEIAVVPTIHMRRFMKGVGGFAPKWRKTIQGVVEKMDQTAKFVEGKRAKADFSPLDTEKVRAFMSDVPKTATPIGQHLEQARTLRKKMEEQMEEHARKQAPGGPDGDDDSEADEDAEERERPVKVAKKELKKTAGKLDKESRVHAKGREREASETQPKSEKRSKDKRKANPPSSTGESVGGEGDDLVQDVTSMDDLLGERKKKKKKRAE